MTISCNRNVSSFALFKHSRWSPSAIVDALVTLSSLKKDRVFKCKNYFLDDGPLPVLFFFLVNSNLSHYRRRVIRVN